MIKGVMLDLDGTVYWGSDAVPGAVDFLNRLVAENVPYLFVTNRAGRAPEVIRDQLRSMGIPCETDHVLTTAQATAQFLTPGRAYVIGGEGLRLELLNAGFEMTDQNPEYVIVGGDPNITYEKIATAVRLVDAGVRFVATNTDRAINTEQGLAPANGAFVAAIATAANREAEVIGKPERAIIDIALERMNVGAGEAVMVGDNLDTDIAAGQNAGVHTALILTGISTREEAEALTKQPTWIVETYEELSERIFA